MDKSQVIVKVEQHVTVMIVKYEECNRNHACHTGTYVLDGCKEYVAKGAEGSNATLTCATCGCHRNFHKRVEVEITEYVGECSPAPANGST